MKKPIVSIIAALGVLLIVTSCKLVMDKDSSNQAVYALKLASGDITSWTQDASEGFSEFKASTLETFINGGAPKYVDEGVVEGFIQNMSNSSKKVIIYVMDFGTASNATAMYAQIDANNGSKIEAQSYSLNTAQLDDSPSSGVTAYAHFGQYFIELSFSEFSDKTEARTTAPNFIEVFETKISQMK